MTCTEERFLHDVAKHEMHIVREDGISREIRFRAPDGSNCWFEIVTWPGCLCINGDHGSYVFSRIADMFEFFRHNGADAPEKPLYINEGYWSEKLQAAACDSASGESKVKNWSADAFRKHLEDGLERHLQSGGIGTPEEEELREDIEELVNDAESDQRCAIADAFHFDKHGLTFEDVYEWDCTEWNFHFIWCLYAIAWGIQQYDKAKDGQVEPKVAA